MAETVQNWPENSKFLISWKNCTIPISIWFSCSHQQADVLAAKSRFPYASRLNLIPIYRIGEVKKQEQLSTSDSAVLTDKLMFYQPNQDFFMLVDSTSCQSITLVKWSSRSNSQHLTLWCHYWLDVKTYIIYIPSVNY